jgi:uncharacterized protein
MIRNPWISILLVVLASGVLSSCAPEESIPADIRARAEQAYVDCMERHGYEVEKIKITSSDIDVKLVLGEDYDLADLIDATSECDEVAQQIIDQGNDTTGLFGDIPHEDLYIEMRDGVKLAATLFLPEGDGPWPTVLLRTPYDRTAEWIDVPTYLDAGIAVLTQDLRGRFDSEGIDLVFLTDGDGEVKDGYDTIAWVTGQPFSNGLVVTEGSSGSGIPQYMQLITEPPGLVGARVVVSTSNLYDSLFRGGVFREGLSVGWLKKQDNLQFLDLAYAHPDEDDFWAPVQTKDAYARANIPVVHLSGWYDIFAQDVLDAFVGYQYQGGDGARGRQKIIMGPWVHGNSGMELEWGDLVLPEQSREAPVYRTSVYAALYTEVLGLDEPLDFGDDVIAYEDVPAVQYYVMGDVDASEAPGNEWRSADDWPPPAERVRFHLEEGGALSLGCPEGGTTQYTFDPEDPSPTLCGANLHLNSGPCDLRSLEKRSDTVVFSTAALEEPLEVTGRVSAHLFVDIDQVDADVMVQFADVYPDGRSILVTEGALRLAARGETSSLSLLEEGEVVEAEVDLLSTSIVVNAGHRLRVLISSSNSTRYQVNPNNGKDFGQFSEGPFNVVEVAIHHEPGAASYLDLPIADGAPEGATQCE